MVASPHGPPRSIRRPKGGRRAVPGAAAYHTRRTVPPILACRPVGRSVPVVLVPAVFDPFPYVPVDIVQSEGVRGEGPYRDGSLSIATFLARTVDVVAVVVGFIGRYGVPEIKRRGGVGACAVLPFRLGQQAVLSSGYGRQPFSVCGGIMPTQTSNRMPIVLRKAGIAPNSRKGFRSTSCRPRLCTLRVRRDSSARRIARTALQ